MEDVLNLIFQGGSWFVGCLAAFIIGKLFIDYITKDKAADRADFKEEKERMFGIMDSQNRLMEQQREMLQDTKELINKQISMEEHNREMLSGLKITIDKMTDIQMLHANRLERIEDRLGRVEENQKIGNR